MTKSASAIVAATAVIETAAEQKDYDENNDPRRTAATTIVVTTATHSRTSFPFSKSYYEKRKKLLQYWKIKLFRRLHRGFVL